MIFQAPKAPAIVTSPMSMEDVSEYKRSAYLHNESAKQLRFFILLCPFMAMVATIVNIKSGLFPAFSPVMGAVAVGILSGLSIIATVWLHSSEVEESELIHYAEISEAEIMAMMPHSPDCQDAFRKLLVAQSGRLLHGQAEILKKEYRAPDARTALNLFMEHGKL